MSAKGNENIHGMTKIMSNVHRDGQRIISYTTHVATIDGGKLLVHGHWSKTTNAQITKVARMFNLDKVDSPLPEAAPEGESNPLRSMGMVMAIGEILGAESDKDKIAWKLRMAKAAGLDVPEDFDSLPQEEQLRRLDGVQKEALKPLP